MGMFSHITRRKFLKGAAAGAAAVGASSVAAPRLGRAAQAVPPGKKLFNDIELTYFQDSNWLHAPLWLSEHLKAEAGVGIKSREQYDGGDAVAKILPQLLSRNPRFDWVQFPSLFFGAFAETGQLEPLDKYLEQYERHLRVSRLGHARLQRVLYEVGRPDLRHHAGWRHPHPPLPQVLLRAAGAAGQVLQALPARALRAEDLVRVPRCDAVLHRGAVGVRGRLRLLHGHQPA